MCYGDPDELLNKLLEANPLVPNRLGNTPLDDFHHVCAFSGLMRIGLAILLSRGPNTPLYQPARCYST